ncbi:hypothetical protein AVEN_224526-1, partial [Araneus ventricosus]
MDDALARLLPEFPKRVPWNLRLGFSVVFQQGESKRMVFETKWNQPDSVTETLVHSICIQVAERHEGVKMISKQIYFLRYSGED